MKIGQLIFHLPAEKKQKIRRIEKINKKIASVKCSLVFNRTCIKENLLPKYTNIYVYTHTYTHIYIYICVCVCFA